MDIMYLPVENLSCDGARRHAWRLTDASCSGNYRSKVQHTLPRTDNQRASGGREAERALCITLPRPKSGYGQTDASARRIYLRAFPSAHADGRRTHPLRGLPGGGAVPAVFANLRARIRARTMLLSSPVVVLATGTCYNR
eukprot:IDg5234t1